MLAYALTVISLQLFQVPFHSTKNSCMFRNYLKTAFRNLRRNKAYSLINILGLSLGLTCAMLIILYVKDEVSYDRFHKNVQHIYRVVSRSKGTNGEFKSTHSGYFQG